LATGLIALLDDVAAIAKVAAATLDDVAGQTAKAGAKAAGVVIDDAAVTPRYVTGFAAHRELPIVRKIAIGSLKNKLLFLLPAALALSALAPWAITPLLMIGGAFLCYEGAEKVYEAFWPHEAHAHEAAVGEAAQDALALESTKVSGAIKTDFILSAEIMAIALATIPESSFWTQALILALVGVGITVGVYGVVALIVKADDAGLALASGRFGGGGPVRAIGRGLVVGMPPFLKLLGVVGTAAMLWVGGGILLHGFETYGLGGLAHLIHDAAAGAGHSVPGVGGVVEWFIGAGAAGLVGLAVGAAIIPLVERVAVPLAKRLKRAPA
jgi:predicted DNA repair protein MutK